MRYRWKMIRILKISTLKIRKTKKIKQIQHNHFQVLIYSVMQSTIIFM